MIRRMVPVFAGATFREAVPDHGQHFVDYLDDLPPVRVERVRYPRYTCRRHAGLWVFFSDDPSATMDGLAAAFAVADLAHGLRSC